MPEDVLPGIPLQLHQGSGLPQILCCLSQAHADAVNTSGSLKLYGMTVLRHLHCSASCSLLHSSISGASSTGLCSSFCISKCPISGQATNDQEHLNSHEYLHHSTHPTIKREASYSHFLDNQNILVDQI